MAKVSYGPIVSDASGKVAGTVFSRWRTRSVVRRLVTPANPNSAAQQAIRNAFRIQTDRYLRGNSDFAQAWTSYAAGKPLTNRSAFIGQTVEEKRQASAWIATPHDPAVFPVLNLLITPGVGELVVTWDNDALPSSGNTLAFYVNETDDDLTISMDSDVVGSVTMTITGLTAGKVYNVSIVKEDDSVTPSRYSIAAAGLGTPT